ncbi:MAG: CPBP family intramembrane metalloprotease [Lachnospira sp.]|nr:CPBP family intramembrane metalloprotease [Lachnospira sp.]
MTKEIKGANRGFLALILFYLLGSILISYLFDVASIDMPVWAQLLLSQAMVFIPGVVYMLIAKKNPIEHCRYKKMGIINVLLTIAYTACCMPIVWFVNFISMLFATNEIQEVSVSFTEYPFIVQLIFMACMPAFVEEFIFRGILYRNYRSGAGFGAAILSGILFGMLHLNINQFMYATVLGILFAILVELTGSIFASSLAHFLVNGFSVTLTYVLSVVIDMMSGETGMNFEEYMQKSQEMAAEPSTVVIQGVMFFGMAIAGAVGLFLCYLGFKKYNKKAEDMKTYFKPEQKAKMITPSLVIAMLICVAYMIWAEI